MFDFSDFQDTFDDVLADWQNPTARGPIGGSWGSQGWNPDFFGRSRGGPRFDRSDMDFPFIYSDLYSGNRPEFGRPSQHFNLPPVNSFPFFRPGMSREDMYPRLLPGDSSLGDWVPVEQFPNVFGPMPTPPAPRPSFRDYQPRDGGASAEITIDPTPVWFKQFVLGEPSDDASDYHEEFSRLQERMRGEPKGRYVIPWDFPGLSNRGGWVDINEDGDLTLAGPPGIEEEIRKLIQKVLGD